MTSDHRLNTKIRRYLESGYVIYGNHLVKDNGDGTKIIILNFKDKL
jgi:hypothetical protein